MALLLFGLVGFTGIVPLSGTSSVVLSNPVATCSASNTCTVSVSVLNSAETQLPINVFFVVKNTAGQTVYVDFDPTSPAIGTSATVTDNLGGNAYPPNSYSVTIFATNVISQPDSNSLIVVLTTTGVLLTVYPGLTFTGGSITLTPAPPSGQPCFNCFQYSVGTTVSLMFNGITGTTFTQWQYSQSGSSPFTTSTANPLSLTLTTNEVVTAIFTAQGAITVTPESDQACGSVNPSTSQQVSFGSAGTTFTANAMGGCLFKGWLLGSSFDKGSVVGNSSSITVTYSMLNTAGFSCNGGCPIAVLTAQFRTLPTVNIVATSGILTTPTPGTYTPPVGPYTISEVTQTGYCFAGWTVNGVAQGTASSVTLNLVQGQFYAVLASGTLAASGGICSGAQGPPPGGSAGAGQIIGAISLLGGAFLTFDGLRRKR